jgi:hypothetical protein
MCPEHLRDEFEKRKTIISKVIGNLRMVRKMAATIPLTRGLRKLI